MFEIDRLHIATKLENKRIIEDAYYAIVGKRAIKIEKKLFRFNADEDEDDFLDIYANHLIEAQAVSIANHLLDLHNDMDIFIKKSKLIKNRNYDKFTYREKRNRLEDYEDIDEEEANDYIQTAIKFLDFELIKESMIKLNKLAYLKAQKQLWEAKINNELENIEENTREDMVDKKEE